MARQPSSLSVITKLGKDVFKEALPEAMSELKEVSTNLKSMRSRAENFEQELDIEKTIATIQLKILSILYPRQAVLQVQQANNAMMDAHIFEQERQKFLQEMLDQPK